MPQEGLRQRRVSSYDDGCRSKERHDGRNISGKSVQGVSIDAPPCFARRRANTSQDGVRHCRSSSIAWVGSHRAQLWRWGHCLPASNGLLPSSGVGSPAEALQIFSLAPSSLSRRPSSASKASSNVCISSTFRIKAWRREPHRVVSAPHARRSWACGRDVRPPCQLLQSECSRSQKNLRFGQVSQGGDLDFCKLPPDKTQRWRSPADFFLAASMTLLQIISRSSTAPAGCKIFSFWINAIQLHASQ